MSEKKKCEKFRELLKKGMSDFSGSQIEFAKKVGIAHTTLNRYITSADLLKALFASLQRVWKTELLVRCLCNLAVILRCRLRQTIRELGSLSHSLLRKFLSFVGLCMILSKNLWTQF